MALTNLRLSFSVSFETSEPFVPSGSCPKRQSGSLSPSVLSFLQCKPWLPVYQRLRKGRETSSLHCPCPGYPLIWVCPMKPLTSLEREQQVERNARSRAEGDVSPPDTETKSKTGQADGQLIWENMTFSCSFIASGLCVDNDRDSSKRTGQMERSSLGCGAVNDLMCWADARAVLQLGRAALCWRDAANKYKTTADTSYATRSCTSTRKPRPRQAPRSLEPINISMHVWVIALYANLEPSRGFDSRHRTIV